MVSFRSPSVRFNLIEAFRAVADGLSDTVDQLIARVNDAGQFDELELVWMLSALVFIPH